MKATRVCFTYEHDRKLKLLAEAFKTPDKQLTADNIDWEKVAANLDNQFTPRQCRMHWLTVLDPSINRSPFTIEEDRLLRKLVQEYGPRWAHISGIIKGRTASQLKSRYRTLEIHRINAEKFRELYERQSTSNQEESGESSTDLTPESSSIEVSSDDEAEEPEQYSTEVEYVEVSSDESDQNSNENVKQQLQEKFRAMEQMWDEMKHMYNLLLD